ncbi:hypothetical protein O6H91_23G062100 [Diphasiastrum complanatum]|uniref:Uncharacterized protein n=1 Tax=Diphasiastrum complanatum TaxID=34168 RepID=A0ACC2AD72_DIPCM|nr:hypothetical protein O6H91_23G062100 [Diphasiastrum complanatum]
MMTQLKLKDPSKRRILYTKHIMQARSKTTNRKARARTTNVNSGKVGHSKNSCFFNPYISCKFCKKTGHAATFCDKRPQDSFKNAFKGKQQETKTHAVTDVADKSRQPGKSFPDEKPECSYRQEPEYNCAYIAQTSTKCMQNDTEKSVSIYVPMNLSPIVEKYCMQVPKDLQLPSIMKEMIPEAHLEGEFQQTIDNFLSCLEQDENSFRIADVNKPSYHEQVILDLENALLEYDPFLQVQTDASVVQLVMQPSKDVDCQEPVSKPERVLDMTIPEPVPELHVVEKSIGEGGEPPPSLHSRS